MLDWRTLSKSNDPKHLVRGTEIESCIPPGFLSRFRIVSVRTVNRSGKFVEYDCKYRVYDAGTVTDAEVKEGIAPKSIGEFATLDDALKFIEPARFIVDAMHD
jgi:hypothetical protein